MAASSVSTAYIAAAANRYSHAADVSSKSLVAFGSNKFIAIWNSIDEEDRGILQTIPGHEGVITCVRFIKEDAFISADDKGFLRIWKKSGSEFKCSCVVQAHDKSVSAIAYYDHCVVTGASDSLVKIWMLASTEVADNLTLEQEISLQGKYPLVLDLTCLPHSNALILAISGTFRDIYIYARSDSKFSLSTTLPGHEDWVRSLAFRNPASPEDALVLASGSQDSTIRLWNIESPSEQASAQAPVVRDDLLDAFEASLGDLAEGEEGRQISLKRHIMSVRDNNARVQKFTITFDALLIGHEGHITSLAWQPSKSGQLPALLSSSTDSSVIIWSPSSSLWINQQRFGDIGGQRLGGFIGGLWGVDGQEVLAWGWSGGWRRWRQKDATEDFWSEVGATSGHSNSVKDLSWSPKGEYLLSASFDQTTRVHGAIPSPAGNPVWHEISRPQVHGYDLVGVQFLDSLMFVSIADEKVARIFEAPGAFVHLVNTLQVAKLDVDEASRPVGASVPPLGLSNKAINEAASEQTAIGSQMSQNRRPFEGELASSTLWPEVEKVFGHGYELISLASSTSKSLFATACKSTSPEHAVVRITDTTNSHQPLGSPLEGHSLTVTRIAFQPPNDKLVLSVSRDRTWRLFEKQTDGSYTPISSDKSHGRIIWDCAWTAEGDMFATASRDKTVKLWHLSDNKWTVAAVLKQKEAATAVAFSPVDSDDRRRLAVGIETGYILIYSSTLDSTSQWELELTINSSLAHVDHIHRLAWRPNQDDSSTLTPLIIKKQLASCGEDHTLRILAVRIKV